MFSFQNFQVCLFFFNDSRFMLQIFHFGEDDVIDVHFSFVMVFGGLRVFIDVSHDNFVNVVLNYQNTSAIGGINYGAPSRINSSFVATSIVNTSIDLEKIKTSICFVVVSTN